MVYENTHLWAAEEIKNRLKNKKIAEIIAANADHYLLGAIFPDTLYFNKEEKIRNFANFLHGETGVPTNTFVFEILDRIKGTHDAKNLAFICGFLTHCAMDIVFHPVVFYLSGYEPKSGPKGQLQSSYLHWYYETLIDKHFNKGVFLEEKVKVAAAWDLVIPKYPNISRQTIIDSLKKQISYFKRIHSRLFYMIYRMLAIIGFIEKKWVAGFYANLNVEDKFLPDVLHYKDIISGEDRDTALEDLMENGINMGIQMIEAAYDYYAGNISKDWCERTVVGYNLDTGRFGKTKEDIRLSLKS
ncbi:MAG: zinc dependent phospholipase C family protein [Deltaproteobacteria bacterium]|jgi:hypothetical protein|nr:zinc dependent phospholipase C family protein [Deltaproteobacteria bacterium]